MLLPSQLSAATLAGPDIEGALHTLQGATMGTTWVVKLVAQDDADLPAIRTATQSELDRVVAQMSTWDAASDLSRFNAAPAQSWNAIPDDFRRVLDSALDLARDTEGAYDPTAGALVDCWGFGPQPRAAQAPTAAEIEAARARLGWQRLMLNPNTGLLLQPGGVSLDFSSIAKGYGVDAVALCLQALGIQHYLVEVGGELRGQGCKPDGSPWWVALELPTDVDEADETLLALDGLAIASSGDYRRYFQQDGHRYSHTLDPRTGWPVNHDLASVTVIHPHCMQADALATALTVLGPEAGLDYAERHQLAVRFLSRHGTELEEQLSSAFLALLED